MFCKLKKCISGLFLDQNLKNSDFFVIFQILIQELDRLMTKKIVLCFHVSCYALYMIWIRLESIWENVGLLTAPICTIPLKGQFGFSLLRMTFFGKLLQITSKPRQDAQKHETNVKQILKYYLDQENDENHAQSGTKIFVPKLTQISSKNRIAAL